MRILTTFFVFGMMVSWVIPCRAEEEPGNFFGKRESSGSSLIGIMYDLKQTQKKEPSGVGANDYRGVMKEFLSRNWDESVLNRYFRAARPLYATQIFIPLMGAGHAPKAFDVEDIMKPSAWVVHYKGQVSPPRDGKYRFLCYSDDFIVVAINGQIICEGSRGSARSDEWQSPKDHGKNVPGGNGMLVYGDWVSLKKDQPVDLDIMVGERPGGQFCAFVLYQKEGDEYAQNEEGIPLYPILQLAEHQTPHLPKNQAPPFQDSSEYWKGYQ